MNFLEIGHAIASDIRVLTRRDCLVDVSRFPVDSPDELLACATSGQAFCDQLVQNFANVKSNTVQEANATLFDSIILIKLKDQCLNTEQLSRYVESTFTSMQYFSDSMKEAFVSDADSEDDEEVTFGVLLFFACIDWISADLDARSFVCILAQMRTVLYFSSSSILTRGEDDFAFDLIEACFDLRFVALKELKKQVISIIHRIPSNDDVELGREVVSNTSDDTIALFVSHYLGSEGIILSFQKAVSAFLALLALFHRLGASVTARLSGRMRKIELMRDMIMRGITNQTSALRIAQEAPAGRILMGKSRTVFTNHLRQFSNTCSPRRGSIESISTLSARQPAEVVLPLEPPSLAEVVLSERASDSPPVYAPVTLTHIPEFSKETAMKSLVHNSLVTAGMSPTKSDQVAAQFADGGSPNWKALNKVVAENELENSITRFESLVSRLENRKLGKGQLAEIKNLLGDIKSITSTN